MRRDFCLNYDTQNDNPSSLTGMRRRPILEGSIDKHCEICPDSLPFYSPVVKVCGCSFASKEHEGVSRVISKFSYRRVQCKGNPDWWRQPTPTPV